jgi:hypothetical protein
MSIENIPPISNSAPEDDSHKCDTHCIEWTCFHCSESRCEAIIGFNSYSSKNSITTLCLGCYLAEVESNALNE